MVPWRPLGGLCIGFWRNLDGFGKQNGVKFDPKNHIDRRWNERAIVFDDAAYALAAIGPPALKVLDHLLTHEDPWVILNAVFALGEIGPPARSSITKIAKLLNHELQQIVRQALDALIFIGGDLLIVLPKIQNLLRTNNPNWQESLVLRGWNGEDQVRLNAAFVLLSGIYGPTNKYDPIFLLSSLKPDLDNFTTLLSSSIALS